MLAVVFGVGSGSTALKEVDLTSLAEDVQRLATMVNQRAWHGMAWHGWKASSKNYSYKQ